MPMSAAASSASPSIPAADAAARRMTPTERRSSISLALIFALRMLGLFLVLPVFMLEAGKYPGGEDIAMVGLAMGSYGMTQAFLQLPMGIASDRWGRKRVIVTGLIVFAIGSLIAALAHTLMGLLIGRAIQGAGAVSAAVTALLADQTREVVRTKAMALVGISIGMMFAIALVAAPLLTAWIGLSGLFGLTFALTLAGIATVLWVVPAEPTRHVDAPRGHYTEVLRHGDLMRVNLGVCALHTVQMSMWVAVPAMLVQAGLPKAEHWQAYLSAIVLSLIAMGGLFSMERHGKLRAALLLSIGLVLLGQIGFGLVAAQGGAHSLWVLGFMLFVFFCGFNVLEATQPSLVSRMSPDNLRGAALGTYNTLQSIGLFLGGAVGGVLVKWGGDTGLFVATTLVTLAWLAWTWPLKPIARAGGR